MGRETKPACKIPNPHAWRPQQAGDSRSPCPALNTLANHGYLPRNGKAISFSTLVCAVKDAYNLSWPFAFLLVLGGYILIRRMWRIDLEVLALHNAVEHDSSAVHADAPRGVKPSYAPTTVDTVLLEQFLSQSANGKVMTVADLARSRICREEMYKPGEISSFHLSLARGESALVLACLGASEAIPLDHLRVWLQEERFPDGWTKPKKRIGLIQTIRLSGEIGKAMAAMRDIALSR